ncbi:hypothetical protein [Endozoicomonas sp. 8E]|uniref:hypothetical protein n=1 Tax=Endozoicomonas sp. 8E TaxID=3035692 RepID=UPI0029392754|nr:hypothetical protein [Endozoicomonas sp. 8E]WOG26918.1 hypothetical protein P6910_20570 [Endozoicomonas sp. 8E]
MTRYFIVELGQDADFPDQTFSIKRTQNSLPGNPSVITETNGHEESDSLPDHKRHSSRGFRIKTTLIESVSWQLLYVTNLLSAYALILNIEDAPLCPTPYSCLPLEVIVAVSWLLKSYWYHDSTLFRPIEQLATFATITAMFGSGSSLPQCQPSGSSGQQASNLAPQFTDYSTSFHYSGSGRR